jgi:hypothetical protein
MALPAIWHSSPAKLFVNYVRCYLRAASDWEADYGGRVSILRTALVRRPADCDWLNNRNTLSNPGTRQEVSNEVISKIESAIYIFIPDFSITHTCGTQRGAQYLEGGFATGSRDQVIEPRHCDPSSYHAGAVFLVALHPPA